MHKHNTRHDHIPQQKSVIINAAAASFAAASAPGNHHHLRFRPTDPLPMMTTTRDDRAEAPD